MIYTLYEVNGRTIKTLEGKTFKIDVMDITIPVTWNPTGRMIYNKDESTLTYEPSGQIVRVIG
jgi:hypothetical protein